jgi:hypothetical protein
VSLGRSGVGVSEGDEEVSDSSSRKDEGELLERLGDSGGGALTGGGAVGDGRALVVGGAAARVLEAPGRPASYFRPSSAPGASKWTDLGGCKRNIIVDGVSSPV